MESSAAATPEMEAANQIAEEEKAIKLAMKRLKLLHIKERLLRNTIPKMLEPLVQKHPSHVMFAAFMKSVDEAQASVKEFTDLMKDETSKEIFARADKSKEENPLGIVTWKHKDHPDWFDVEKN